ncbi:MAG: penicillin-binding transpeptidase domain-containing protein, partial [Bacteroidota bacterium]|nr:penicillin-binding transpeptidase domain-containing protein [Bacteroidota bacterium]
FNAVHDGMQGVMERGTGAAAKVPGVTVCGKTGTVENYYKGVKQKSHAFFAAFAPRENPQIAIAVICENAGFGASSAAPIASLMIEKYLKDSIAGDERKAKVETLAKLNLMPARIYQEIRYRDSLMHSRDTSYMLEKGYIKSLKDSMGIENDDETEALEKLKNSKQKEKILTDTIPPKKNENDLNPKPGIEGVLPENQKKGKSVDSIK